ncbi:AraC family transcriptional regulator [Roseburia sp. MSJ-14]|nr:AraC family transcriptional regulator [Roseburia sp. MSJ-14]
MISLHTSSIVADLKIWCDTHYSEKFSLDELAESFRISKYKLCRDFSSYFHVSPLQYLNNRRIDYAKKLLLSTNNRIYEIGNAVGIENTNHFINLLNKESACRTLSRPSGVVYD